jgi:hypothetical protein
VLLWSQFFKVDNMNVIDISERIFTKDDRDELCSILRQLAKKTESDDTMDLRSQADFLMRKAGGPEKFFKNQSKLLEEIL